MISERQKGHLNLYNRSQLNFLFICINSTALRAFGFLLLFFHLYSEYMSYIEYTALYYIVGTINLFSSKRVLVTLLYGNNTHYQIAVRTYNLQHLVLLEYEIQLTWKGSNMSLVTKPLRITTNKLHTDIVQNVIVTI
jgi:hypothetical protein